MLLDRYEQEGRLFNVNFKDQTSNAGQFAYRGELVLVEGEIGDAAGRRKPPVAVMRGAVLLVDGDKIKMVSGAFDRLDQVSLFTAKYGADLAADATAMFFVVNIPSPIRVVVDGLSCFLIPMVDGMVWNELLEELALEKGDFKGQSAADKVVTVYGAFGDYRPKYSELSWDVALAGVVDVKREQRGPI